MPVYVTGDEILTFVGVDLPGDAAEIAWSLACASAVQGAIESRLGGAVIADPGGPLNELRVAARIAGAEAFKRKEATFGITGFADLEGAAIRVARDYMDGVRPLVDRYTATPGGGIG